MHVLEFLKEIDPPSRITISVAMPFVLLFMLMVLTTRCSTSENADHAAILLKAGHGPMAVSCAIHKIQRHCEAAEQDYLAAKEEALQTTTSAASDKQTL